ncbi:helix-turn-helix domain-containing protein [Microlunatus endophyticus]
MSKRRLVVSAVLAGSSQSEVARRYGVSQGWISRLMARYRVEGSQRSSRVRAGRVPHRPRPTR